MGIVSNIKSSIIKKEVIKAMDKLDPSLIVPSIDNILESICLNENDGKEVKSEIKNKLMELIRGLDK